MNNNLLNNNINKSIEFRFICEIAITEFEMENYSNDNLNVNKCLRNDIISHPEHRCEKLYLLTRSYGYRGQSKTQ